MRPPNAGHAIYGHRVNLDLDYASASQLTAALRARTVSSREVLEHLLTRLERYNPTINAVVALDVDRARTAAAAADDAAARGEFRGPLHGLPMTIKDAWETEGLVTTCGADELRGYVPRTDALAVARLKEAGAIVFGKTNVPIYAGDWQTFNDVYGITNNPWDITRTVGGSSGGAAAAVAAGITPLELGSDFGGSIRNPAHYNGIYGFKPSWGVVPGLGHIPGPPGSRWEPDINCYGPLARSIGDLDLAFGVIAGPNPADAKGWRLQLDAGPPLRDASEVRVAVVFDQGEGLLPLAQADRAVLDSFVQRLVSAGATVEFTALPVPLADGLRTWQELALPILGMGLPDAQFDELVALEQVPGSDPVLDGLRSFVSRYRSWGRANARRQQHRAAWAAMFERYDVVLAPVMPTAAFVHDTKRPIEARSIDVDGTAVSHPLAMAWTGAIGAVLLPVVSVPAGLNRQGLPVGIQVIGGFLSDLRLLRIAALLDDAAGPGFIAPPECTT
ncbi:MAG: hypothetical protein JWL70_2711 [Acidimicrobiia bacterium]|nr:hypothetical protein [Acidimicrobiia bacterium]